MQSEIVAVTETWLISFNEHPHNIDNFSIIYFSRTTRGERIIHNII